MDITGKTALITGAASGIGLAAAHQLVQRRIGRLMLADLNEAAFEHIRQDLKTEENQEIECRRVDVSKVGEIAGLYDRLNSRFGAPDIVFNCAGIVTGAPGFPDVSVGRRGDRQHGLDRGVQSQFTAGALFRSEGRHRNVVAIVQGVAW